MQSGTAQQSPGTNQQSSNPAAWMSGSALGQTTSGPGVNAPQYPYTYAPGVAQSSTSPNAGVGGQQKNTLFSMFGGTPGQQGANGVQNLFGNPTPNSIASMLGITPASQPGQQQSGANNNSQHGMTLYQMAGSPGNKGAATSTGAGMTAAPTAAGSSGSKGAGAAMMGL